MDQQLKVMARHASPTIGFHVRGGNLSHPEKSRVNPVTCCIYIILHYPATFCYGEHKKLRNSALLVIPSTAAVRIP